MTKKTEVARGWGERIEDSPPFLAHEFSLSKKEAEEKRLFSNRIVRVVILPLGEYRRLKRIERESQK